MMTGEIIVYTSKSGEKNYQIFLCFVSKALCIWDAR